MYVQIDMLWQRYHFLPRRTFVARYLLLYFTIPSIVNHAVANATPPITFGGRSRLEIFPRID